MTEQTGPGDVNKILTQAVYSKDVSEVCRHLLALPAGKLEAEKAALVHQTREVLSTIQSECIEARQWITGTLAAKGVVVSDNTIPLAGQQESRNPKSRTYHIIRIRVDAGDLSTAFNVFKDEGFICSEQPGRAGFELLKRFYPSVTLIKPDDVSLKMKVSWQPALPPSGLMRFLRPSPKDSQVLDLPASLWPLYYVIRPLRIVTEKLTRRTSGEIAPFMGTPISLIRPILEFASVTKHDVLIDLGCGDGRVVIETARVVGCRAIGVELDMALVERAQKNVAESELEQQIQIRHSNATEFNLNDSTVIFLFLPIKTVKKLIPDLLQRLKPGSRIVTHEQQAPNHSIPPTRSKLILSDNAMTVAHLWEV